MSAIGKPVNPVTAAELEGLSLRVTQACSTIHLIIEACDQLSHVQNALGLLELELDRCAEDLGHLHNRCEDQQKARS